jgi:hypothetical protein
MENSMAILRWSFVVVFAGSVGCASILDLGGDLPPGDSPGAPPVDVPTPDGAAPHLPGSARAPDRPSSDGRDAAVDVAAAPGAGRDAGAVVVDAGDDPPSTAEGGAGDAGSGALLAFDFSNAIVAGTGCSAANTTLTQVPGGFHLVFTALASRLPDANARADMRSCLIRVAVTVPAGFYVSRLRQKVGYAVAKASAGSAAAATMTTLFGAPVAPKTIEFAEGVAVDMPNGFWSAWNALDTSSSSYQGSCTRGTTKGLFGASLAVAATIPSDDAAVTVAIPGFDFVPGDDYELTPCVFARGVDGGLDE